MKEESVSYIINKNFEDIFGVKELKRIHKSVYKTNKGFCLIYLNRYIERKYKIQKYDVVFQPFEKTQEVNPDYLKMVKSLLLKRKLERKLSNKSENNKIVKV